MLLSMIYLFQALPRVSVKNHFPFIPYFFSRQDICSAYFYPKSAVGREIGAFGKEVKFLFGDWGKIGIIR